MDDINETVDPVLHSSAEAQERMKIAKYTRVLYQYYLLVLQGLRVDGEGLPPPPSTASAELIGDCKSASRMLAQAARNRCM